MSKEQLETGFVIETAKREVVIAKGINNTRNYVNLPIDLVLVLIEQAERVQELEFRNEITENRNYKLEQTFKDYQQVNKNMYDMIGDLKIKNLKIEQQNKRYRERLEYILSEAIDHKKRGFRIQHWALIKDLERALEGENE